MAWIFLAESEESQRPWLPGCDQSPTVKSTDTLNLYCYLEWLPDQLHVRQFGIMYAHLDTLISNNLELTLLPAAFLAKISVLRELEQAWQESEADYFTRSQGSLASFDPVSCSWKTSQQSLLEEGRKWSEPLPRWGMTVDGVLYRLKALEQIIKERDGFFWPTPCAQDAKNSTLPPSQTERDTLPGALIRYGYPTGGKLNPPWVEWLMGYPIGWTELKPWATQWFRSKREKRLKS